MIRSWSRPLLVAVAAVALLSSAAAAHAQEPAESARVRVAHLSPDTPGVDVYVDGQPVISNMGFEIVSDYLEVPAGSHHVEVRPSGAPVASVAVLAQDVTLAPGGVYTIAGVGPRATLGLRVFDDAVPAPGPGQAAVRVIHGAIDAPTVDLVAAGAPLVTDAAPGAATPYAPVAAGTYDLVVQDAATGAEVATAPGVELGPGIAYTIAVVGGGGQPARLLPVVDARAASVAPVGALATGMGGLAGDDDASPAIPPAAVVGALLVVAASVALVASTRRTCTPRTA